MKVRANSTGVYAGAGFFSLREGTEYDVDAETGENLVAAGVADAVEDEKPKPRGKKVDAAPENK